MAGREKGRPAAAWADPRKHSSPEATLDAAAISEFVFKLSKIKTIYLLFPAVWLKRNTCWGPTGVGYDEVSSLVVEGSVSGAGRVPRACQTLVAKVQGVAVIQQRLSDLKPGVKTVSTVTLKPPICSLFF